MESVRPVPAHVPGHGPVLCEQGAPNHLRITLNAKYSFMLGCSHPAALADPALALDVLEGLCKHWSVGIYTPEGKAPSPMLIASISLRTKMRITTLQERFIETALHGAIVHDNIFNACDKGFYTPIPYFNGQRWTKTDGLWTDINRSRLAMPRHIMRMEENNTFYYWQKQIIHSLKIDETGRKVNVLIDGGGNSGKSTVAIYSACKGLAHRIPQLSSHTDLMQMVHSLPVMPAYFFDIPRQIGVHGAGQMWSAIEEIKNGCSYDKRYHGRMRFFDPPNVWVFTNDLPNISMLSKDRWRFWRILNGKLVQVDMNGQTALQLDLDLTVSPPATQAEPDPIEQLVSAGYGFNNVRDIFEEAEQEDVQVDVKLDVPEEVAPEPKRRKNNKKN